MRGRNERHPTLRHVNMWLWAVGFLGSMLIGVFGPLGGGSPFDKLSVETARASVGNGIVIEPVKAPRNGTQIFARCSSNSSWTRPSVERQEQRLTERGSSFDDQHRRQFRAGFWRETGDPAATGEMLQATGLWTVGESGLDLLAMSRSGCSEHPAYNPSLVNLWLLGYAAEAAHLSGGRIIVEVQSRPVGFQTLQIRLPQGTTAAKVQVDFIDSDGQVLETIPGAAIWSRP